MERNGGVLSQGVAVLGSTGSIGTQSLEVIAMHPERFHVAALAAGQRIELLADQVRRFRPRRVCVADQEGAKRLASMIDFPVEILYGLEGLVEVAVSDHVDIALIAVVGARGIRPTIAALKAGKRVALANKESLVAAGEVVKKQLATGTGTLLPVDSEHSAIFQCLQGEDMKSVQRLVLTASGGPFRTMRAEDMHQVTAIEALQHPTWSMGGKITVDSATLMNKGLEVIEARWLFDLDYDAIDVVVHPQSIVHSLVEFVDGSMVAQLGAPDMRLPIQYALCYPTRPARMWNRLSLSQSLSLTFEPPDLVRFPALRLAYEAGRIGGTAPAVLNAANEVAVDAFLRGQCRFTQIPQIVETVLEGHRTLAANELETVLNADQEARVKASELVAELSGGAMPSASHSHRGEDAL